jgi:hypothetical protein
LFYFPTLPIPLFFLGPSRVGPPPSSLSFLSPTAQPAAALPLLPFLSLRGWPIPPSRPRLPAPSPFSPSRADRRGLPVGFPLPRAAPDSSSSPARPRRLHLGPARPRTRGRLYLRRHHLCPSSKPQPPPPAPTNPSPELPPPSPPRVVALPPLRSSPPPLAAGRCLRSPPLPLYPVDRFPSSPSTSPPRLHSKSRPGTRFRVSPASRRRLHLAAGVPPPLQPPPSRLAVGSRSNSPDPIYPWVKQFQYRSTMPLLQISP